MAKAIHFVILFCGLVSIYGLPTNSDDDTKGCKRLDTSCMKKRYKRARKDSEKRRNIKHSAIPIAEEIADELKPAENRVIDVYMTNKEFVVGDDGEYVYSTDFHAPQLYHHPSSDREAKRSNIIIPYQNFVVNDERIANNIKDVAREAVRGEKRNPSNGNPQDILDNMEYQRQIKIQHQRQLDMQHWQQMYINRINQLEQPKPPVYHVTPSSLFVEYPRPRALYNPPASSYLHQSHTTYPNHVENEQSERDNLQPILNAYHTLLRTPIKDFVKALHMSKYDHES